METVLEVRNLIICYGNLEAVHGVSFSVGRGELVSIIGANGAGKTSVLNGIMGLVQPKGGAILWQGQDVTTVAPYKRARMGIRMVPERGVVFPYLTVLENLRVGQYGQRDSQAQRRLEWIYELFPILKERSGQLARTLSGGEQQQLSIARALVSEPELLLVDEVSMGLMPKLVVRVFSLLESLNREKGLTMLLVEQNARASLRISHRAYVLETGSIVLQGTPDELLHEERVRRAYLGA